MRLLQEHNRSTLFPAAPKCPSSWHRGGKHTTVLKYITTELKDRVWVSFTRGVTEQAARLYALGGLTWHIWEQSLSHPCRWGTGFSSKRIMYWKYFMLMCNCGQMDGARGLYQRYRATSSPMALGSLSTGEAHWVGLDKYLSILASKIPTLACQWIC